MNNFVCQNINVIQPAAKFLMIQFVSQGPNGQATLQLPVPVGDKTYEAGQSYTLALTPVAAPAPAA